MSQSSSSSSAFHYLAWVGITACTLTAGLITLNYHVDPYFIHQWNTPNLTRLSPAQQNLVPWAKTYAVYRYNPEIIFLGSSRVEIGLPVDLEFFNNKRVFNLAINGASLGDAINLLRHTSYFHRPEIVIWGLDYGWQFGLKSGNTDFKEDLVAKFPWYPIKRFLLNIKMSISMSLTLDAWKILLDISDQKCPPLLATFGHKSNQCLEFIMEEEGGASKAFDKIILGDPSGKPGDVAGTMQALDTTTREYCNNGVVFRFFLNPVHALAELSFWGNRLQDHEEWKRQLVNLFDRRREEGCDIRFFDFTGYNSVTSEDIPQITGRNFMHYYWEYSHYSSEAGKKILERLLDVAPSSHIEDFGVELEGNTIQRHLIDFRDKRVQYCKKHPLETRNLAACNKSADD